MYIIGSLKKISALALLCTPFLAGCLGGPYPYQMSAGLLLATSTGIFSNPDINLREKNYAAADFLQSQFGKRVSLLSTIKARPLEELDNPGITSPLGRHISEGVGLRLAELGYKLQLQDVAPHDNYDLYPESRYKKDADFILKGFYTVASRHVDVILHLVDVKTHDVVARYDYQMALTREIKDLAQTTPSIFRVQGSADNQTLEKNQ
ncbi:MAG: hypothetical protein ACLFP8_05320 [Alphaproteobacteria bacterium]